MNWIIIHTIKTKAESTLLTINVSCQTTQIAKEQCLNLSTKYTINSWYYGFTHTAECSAPLGYESYDVHENEGIHRVVVVTVQFKFVYEAIHTLFGLLLKVTKQLT
ncbi:CLUMA_CG010891, isoform A [Clunio marinus]|uniref:CLUMA_CG010891, isoform A n=1 Tax=Clunio marinus TaxID=568069 RepID=A0A1J1IES6_9DIPT|nr:CLUMA_CG010891, isoform A [Clunio marinus]